MVRTQIYLDERQKDALERLSAERGSSMAQLIRTAVDRLLEDEAARALNFATALDNAFGLWKKRTDIDEGYSRRIRDIWTGRLNRHQRGT